MSNKERKGEYIAFRATEEEYSRVQQMQKSLNERFGMDFSISQTLRFMLRLGVSAYELKKKYKVDDISKIPLDEGLTVFVKALIEEAKEDEQDG